MSECGATVRGKRKGGSGARGLSGNGGGFLTRVFWKKETSGGMREEKEV